jgi:Tfp pilus assembly protein PilO
MTWPLIAGIATGVALLLLMMLVGARFVIAGLVDELEQSERDNERLRRRLRKTDPDWRDAECPRWTEDYGKHSHGGQ